ncbi:hypothetical protein TNCT_142971 [Trichonephila clavata]|uniref:Uncharacterized protein n=1 Tax=Trichonephila clavata TaxID=2740835 RepID=A0A8X6KSS7_TRICU|nr:hypothetical protein TNCT_142971 [Trichonephila clavata]
MKPETKLESGTLEPNETGIRNTGARNTTGIRKTGARNNTGIRKTGARNNTGIRKTGAWNKIVFLILGKRKKSGDVASRWNCLSSVRRRGTNFADTRRMFKSFLKISSHDPTEM